MAHTISEGKVVDLSYTLKSSTGELLDQAEANDPFSYLHGGEQIVPGLEEGLEGLKVGDKKQVVVEPEMGYGEFDPKLKVVANRSQFPASMKVQAGMQFQTESPSGEEIVFTVESIEGDKVHVDGNHPLAGQTLHFDVEVLGIREATSEEMEHGHPHGPDGHGHHHDHDHDGCDHDHGDEE